MGRVLDDDALRESLVAAGLARAAEFTWARTAAATAGVYRDALA
jgi:glycosyltransferase involved in cell wall biosynthesis